MEQVVNLVCAQSNLASYPQRDEKWVDVVAYGLWIEGLLWLIGTVVCRIAAPHAGDSAMIQKIIGANCHRPFCFCQNERGEVQEYTMS